MAQKNPWNIGSLYEFFYFNCPSCPFKSKSNQEFVNHACNFHPEAGPYLQNIQDNSINDIHVPYHEFENKVSNDRIENKNEVALLTQLFGLYMSGSYTLRIMVLR